MLLFIVIIVFAVIIVIHRMNCYIYIFFFFRRQAGECRDPLCQLGYQNVITKVAWFRTETFMPVNFMLSLHFLENKVNL